MGFEKKSFEKRVKRGKRRGRANRKRQGISNSEGRKRKGTTTKFRLDKRKISTIMKIIQHIYVQNMLKAINNSLTNFLK